MTTLPIVVACSMLAGLPIMAEASAFRGSSNFLAAESSMKVEELRAIMLDELMSALGSGNKVTEQRLSTLEEALRATFLAMPKNAHGNLDHAGVRYVLHRLFVQRHGMYIKGLDPGSDKWKWNSSSPADILEDRVPTFVQGLFEERLSDRGLGVRELAIMAATLEHLIHKEAEDKLKNAYSIAKVPLEDRMGHARAKDVLAIYQYLFLRGTEIYSAADFAQVHKMYPRWEGNLEFMDQVMTEVAGNNAADSAFAGGELSFNATSQVVAEIGERYGKWQNQECMDLKHTLMKIESKNAGRVLLKDFYGGAMGGAWQFTESEQYLRSLGDLDETDPARPSVLISNYINSASNCLSSTSLYSVCCLNECEDLLGHVEREVAGPDAAPERLAEIIERLPSATVAAPRKLPETLRARLQDIADRHGGQVQLHGRLFAQFLHHAYPRECPYPHSKTTNPMTASDWMSDSEESPTILATADEMTKHAKAELNEDGAAAGAAEQTVLWTDEEELVVVRPSGPGKAAAAVGASTARQVAMVTAFIALALVLKDHLLHALAALKGGDRQKGGLPFATSGSKEHFC